LAIEVKKERDNGFGGLRIPSL